jgi:hypothetical protein
MKFHSFGREKKKGQECLGQSEGEAAMTILKVDNLRMTIYFRYNIPTLQFAKKKSKFSRKHLK